ncbi:hypothetical protein QVD17_08225 [Tagetes erecta]|uniref:HAT C-terminal dimerisation domain-containing protein n=1 Tax=Tagetes erecta TaxID=13708 RepID=A0AAD8KZA2_TARER|nr:hypothetical protein QVD17_08225 [Tagetes erecta]
MGCCPDGLLLQKDRWADALMGLLLLRLFQTKKGQLLLTCFVVSALLLLEGCFLLAIVNHNSINHQIPTAAVINTNGLCDLARLMVETGKHRSFPLAYRILKLALVLPVATATVERSFSKLKLVKTDLRNRMGDEFLNGALFTSNLMTNLALVAKVVNEDWSEGNDPKSTDAEEEDDEYDWSDKSDPISEIEAEEMN